MLTLLAQGLLLIFFGTCWQVLRRLLVKTDLDNVAGPASDSHILGEYWNSSATSKTDLALFKVILGSYSTQTGGNFKGILLSDVIKLC